MIRLKDVQGSKEAAQELIIGKDTVYIHSNIRKLEETEGLKESEDIYIYDEIQMTKNEYLEKLQKELNVSNNAMADLMMMIGGME
ncbi:MAG: hypothetical protein E6084_00840 [Peptoniphilus harei]|nr:hypothetical protein [Peptoniphilus harei]